ncbi:SufD family Fe-S cluster assembly protein [Erythrobacter crassostreae]|uniref:SufD family Fe-S cluster assembly protein n=1 Tax=Erythrobacter crassostreae TaxID=2828328 RepID=A0A9X1JNP4_9SPHN|nr:SufD family Fe-S cluster assembly protein [Erythrobacter crassostrea]MBV7258622.1 SufD family Fe-S cluster assembly protein [Erythrobacter crassostrea]
MTEAQTLPTRRDEAWRYADIDAVQRLGTAALDAWQDIAVANGETWQDTMVIGTDAPELRRIRLTLGEGATAAIFVTNTGRDFTRVEVEVTLGKGAHFEFGGVTIGGGDAVREFVTTTIHAEPDATSNQTVRAVHWGTGTGNFLGEIKVARHAQKTDAAQDFKGLLLEAGASANAVPQLEIFADDVKCAHGATVGQLDEAARYYMAARGLSPEQSQRLLVQAFLGDAFVELDDEAAREKLLEAALTALEGASL